MTKKEFLELRRRDKIFYTGKDKLVLLTLSPTTLKHGLTIKSVSGYDDELTIRRNGWDIEKVNPKDWKTNTSIQLSRKREQEKENLVFAKSQVHSYLLDVRSQIDYAASTKQSIDTALEEIPLAEKFKILSTLSKEEQLWLEIISQGKEKMINALKKLVEVKK